MEFEWDEAKRQSNLRKHQIDFLRMQLLFDGRPQISTKSVSSSEPRFLTTGEIDGVFYTVVWTWRGGAVRIISARRSRDAERRDYRSIHS
ncbi:MAG: BrnT family toxin [Thermomicrobiales bacterium]|nr:BrnT family toxin [Thermomicrobiales bacterium]